MVMSLTFKLDLHPNSACVRPFLLIRKLTAVVIGSDLRPPRCSAFPDDWSVLWAYAYVSSADLHSAQKSVTLIVHFREREHACACITAAAVDYKGGKKASYNKHRRGILPLLSGENHRRPLGIWRSRVDHLQPPYEGGLDVSVVLVPATRTAVESEDRLEGISQGNSRVRLGHPGERKPSR